MNREAHEDLLAKCPGYAAFVAEEMDGADHDTLIDFADWFLSGGEDADTYDHWSADDFLGEWGYWHG